MKTSTQTYKKIFYRGMILIVLWGVIACIYYWYNEWINEKYLSRFTYFPDTNSFKETQQQVFFDAPKYQHAVLLLHGYAGSPDQLTPLFEQMRQANIPFVAPKVLGFGLGTPHLLRTIKDTDWIRQAIEYYDLLSQIAHKVSVIGVSNGGTIAMKLSEQRPIHHLILIGPNAFVHPSDAFIKKMLQPSVSLSRERLQPSMAVIFHEIVRHLVVTFKSKLSHLR